MNHLTEGREEAQAMQTGEGGMIYRQIAGVIEDGILSGAYPEDAPVPSTNRFAQVYRINPATAAKGVKQLADDGILYKRRGLGMYVAPGAKEILLARRRAQFFSGRLKELVIEAGRLRIGKEELIAAIEGLYEREKGTEND